MFVLYLFLAFLAGMLLGAVFFGGLWWTVQRITGSDSPYLVMAVSFFVRAAVVLVGFYLLVRADWPFLIAALVGFIAARTILAYKLKPPVKEAAKLIDNQS